MGYMLKDTRNIDLYKQKETNPSPKYVTNQLVWAKWSDIYGKGNGKTYMGRVLKSNEDRLKSIQVCWV